ncbi:response regulator [Paenibacillus sp. N4]|uniref:response regulator transcription factor n=1 Tax=Paenibacillus vietnamensis TaxID=2590547 RepID=UPI001CD0C0E2|nr:response regulator [Paenibacillus vietnamensis]MCA0757291.1 response regulator [Paenibacillus vietnamensis]
MYKVLAVDDEPLMIEGWRTMIDWNAFGYELSGTASDGEEALELIRLIKPEVVVTDVRMPIMDGLELIKVVKEEMNLHIQFVIVSGYSEFAYAQQALRYQVNHYILKPLIVDEIYELLAELSHTLEKNRLAEKSANKNKEIIVAAAITSLLKKENEVNTDEVAEVLGLKTDSLIRLVIAECPAVEGGTDEYSQLREFLKTGFGGLRTWLFTEAPNRTGLLICHEDEQDQEQLMAILQGVIMKVEQPLQQLILYVSEAGKGLTALPELYRQVLETRYSSLFSRRSGIHLYQNDSGFEEWKLEDIITCSDSLLRSIETNDEKGINSSIDHLILLFGQTCSQTVWIQHALNYIRGELLNNYSISAMDKDVLGQLLHENYFSQKELIPNDALKILCLRIAKEVKIGHPASPSNHSFTMEVIEYLKSHYREKIQVQELAERFHYNPVYFGKQFRKETGMSLNEYIHALRIDEAKILLRRTDMKLTEIASYLNYHSTEYFTSKFKVFTNELPSSYKNKYKGDWFAE